MNRISPANIIDSPSSLKLMFKPNSGSQGQWLVTVWPAMMPGAMLSSSASASPVTVHAATAAMRRERVPSTNPARDPISMGSKTMNNNMVTGLGVWAG